MREVVYRPIGVVRSDHTDPAETPVQPVYAAGCTGRAIVRPEYVEGLQDLDGFSHIYLIYHFDRAEAARLTVRPFLQDKEHGVFATRAPCRPNPIGISIVELLGIQGDTLLLRGVDVLDGTPLLDIKPYVGRFDRFENPRCGWQDEVDEESALRRARRGYTGP